MATLTGLDNHVNAPDGYWGSYRIRRMSGEHLRNTSAFLVRKGFGHSNKHHEIIQELKTRTQCEETKMTSAYDFTKEKDHLVVGAEGEYPVGPVDETTAKVRAAEVASKIKGTVYVLKVVCDVKPKFEVDVTLW